MTKDRVGEETLKIMKTVSWYNNWLYLQIEGYLHGRILEIGAGIGNFTELLKQKGELYTLDINSDYISELKKAFGKSVHISVGDIEKGNYNFKNINFEAIVCMNVLEHIKNDILALKNINELLSKKGRFILLVPAHQLAFGSLDEELGHYRRYSKADLAGKLISNNFIIEDMRYINLMGIFGWFFNSRVLKRKLMPTMQLIVFNFIARPLLASERYFEAPFGLSLLTIARKK